MATAEQAFCQLPPINVEGLQQQGAYMRQSAADTATIQLLPGQDARTNQMQRVRLMVETDERLLLTVPEAARRLRIGRSMMYEMLAADKIESIHVGRLRRIPADALVAYVDRQRGSQTLA